jgi:hypothetical protein
MVLVCYGVIDLGRIQFDDTEDKLVCGILVEAAGIATEFVVEGVVEVVVVEMVVVIVGEVVPITDGYMNCVYEVELEIGVAYIDGDTGVVVVPDVSGVVIVGVVVGVVVVVVVDVVDGVVDLPSYISVLILTPFAVVNCLPLIPAPLRRLSPPHAPASLPPPYTIPMINANNNDNPKMGNNLAHHPFL